MEKSLITLIVPEEILKDFEYTGHELVSNVYRIYLREKDDLEHKPLSKTNSKLVKDGYFNPIELQTYPLKGKEVFLYLRRRRWKIKGSNEDIYNEYEFHKKGMKATKEFGFFLKEIGRG